LGLRLLTDLWDDAATVGMDEADLLRYRSNLLGSDKRLTNYGGGNTSAKIRETDPLTGETATVLWVKGSGGDLGTIRRDGFATLYQDKLEALKRRYRGVEHEDEMVDFYPLCTFANNPRAASIDTPLHAFLPFTHVDHLHPDWAIALAASANGPAQLERLHKETGVRLIWLPWKRPGFELGLWLEKAVQEDPDADGILLGSHGLFTWGDTARRSYENTLRVLDAVGAFLLPRIETRGGSLFGGPAAATRPDRDMLVESVLPSLRGLVSEGGPAVLGHFDGGEDVMRFVNSRRAPALAYQGTSCPDHFVRTKVRPLYVEWDAANGTAADLIAAAKATLPTYREDYARYYDENKQPDSPPMRPANPTVVLVPGVGLFSFGKNKAEARVTAEFYTNAIHVMEGATALEAAPSPASGHPSPVPGEGRDMAASTASGSPLPALGEGGRGVAEGSVVDNYVALAPREAFDIEYWSLEEAKLRRMPAEKELSRKVAVIAGGGGPGIGRAIALRLAEAGAHVVVSDLKPELAEETAKVVRDAHGAEAAVAEAVDCTDRASVRRMLRAAVRQYGGVDILVVVAAVFFPPDEGGRITEDQWRKTLDVNLLGSYVPADEAIQILREQGTGGSVILISSANAVVAKRGSFAYDVSKAALNHLVREMAVEGGPAGVRVNGIAPASVVEGSQQFPRERVETSLAKYGIAFTADETTEALRGKLSDFYAARTLLKRRVTPAAVAEAAFLLASEKRASLLTGQILPVDAGLTEAFLR
jgi:rhamnose utilization protein RhaD (predicted bifunctional aldolase and dehydrogenase)/NAD(P)-dependent dehydrogenase (short-subunit alcohol dehydrogenase family)